MTRNKKEISVCFQLKSVDLLESKMLFPSLPVDELEPYEFVVRANDFVRKSIKSIIVIVDATINSSKTKKKVAFVKVGCIYEVKNFDSFVNEKSGKVILPINFQKIIRIVSISTTRGIVFSEFRGTYLHSAVLPIINAKGIQTSELLC